MLSTFLNPLVKKRNLCQVLFHLHVNIELFLIIRSDSEKCIVQCRIAKCYLGLVLAEGATCVEVLQSYISLVLAKGASCVEVLKIYLSLIFAEGAACVDYFT